MNILTIGDNCVDIYTDERIGFPGGGCVNVAVFMSKLGAKTTYIGAFGKDKSADFIINALKEENVNTDRVQFFNGNTALAFVKHVDLERIFLGSDRGVRYNLTPDKLNEDYYRNFDLIHTTLDGQVDAFIKEWGNLDIKISYDFSHRALPEQIKLLKYIDYAFFSAGDQVTRIELEKRAKEYKQLGANVMVFTRGKLGSLAYDGERFYEQKAKSIKIVDTLACGDAYISAFLTSQLKKENIKKSLERATEYATKALRVKGAFGHATKINNLDIKIEDYVMYDKPRR
jgi:fructoselysine 6-kinase